MERIQHYASLSALAADAASRKAARHETHEDAWYGNETAAQSLRLAVTGDDRLVAQAEAIIAKLDAAIDAPNRELIADCVGAYPVVPDYLMGMPECMRRRAAVPNEASPIAIWVCLTSSGRVTTATLLQRGVAILALTMALAQTRPIDLHVFNIGRRGETESVITAPLNTRPLDLASACYALTSPGFCRRLCYGLAQELHIGVGGIKWPEGYVGDKAAYLAGVVARMGGEPARDLIIDGAHSGDAMLSDPIAWVNAQIARFREIDQ